MGEPGVPLREEAPSPRRPLPGQHRRRPVDERPGTPPSRNRRVARRLQPLRVAPRGRPVARAAERARPTAAGPVEGLLRAPAAHRPVPLHVRSDAGAAVPPVPAAAGVRQAVGDALPRLRHPWEVAARAGLREEGGRRDRRQLRRDPLGPRGRDDPAGRRPVRDPARAAVGSRAARDRPRPVLTTAEGNRSRPPRVRRARRRPPDRRGAPPPGGTRAVPGRRHRRRPAERRVVRPVRDRVHGARQARRDLPPRGGDPPHRGGVRRPGARRERVRRHAPDTPRGARRARGGRPGGDRRCLTRVRRARPRPRARHRPARRALRNGRRATEGASRDGRRALRAAVRADAGAAAGRHRSRRGCSDPRRGSPPRRRSERRRGSDASFAVWAGIRRSTGSADSSHG